MPGFSQCNPIPQRWIMVILGFFVLFNSYSMKSSFQLALLKMVVPHNYTETFVGDTCPSFKNNTRLTSFSSGNNQNFKWNHKTQGLILSSFFWGYTLAHIFAGFLVKKFGAKMVIGFSIFLPGLLTTITPFTSNKGNVQVTIASRVLIGFFDGMIQPSIGCFLSQWVPPQERSFLGTIVYIGVPSGLIYGMSVSGIILANFSWSMVFYWFGLASFILLIFWLLLFYNNPREHPFITKTERDRLVKELSKFVDENPAAFPWRQAFSSIPLLVLIVTYSANDYFNYTVLINIKKYMNGTLKIPIDKVGYILSVNQFGSFLFSLVISKLSDQMINKKILSRTNVRKICVTVSHFIACYFMILASYAECNHKLFICFFMITMILRGSWIPAVKINVLDLSPNYSGFLMGICNGIGAICGMFAPYVVGVLTPNQSLSEWNIVFWIVFIVLITTNVIFVCFGSGEIQKWNDPKLLFADTNRVDLEESSNPFI